MVFLVFQTAYKCCTLNRSYRCSYGYNLKTILDLSKTIIPLQMYPDNFLTYACMNACMHAELVQLISYLRYIWGTVGIVPELYLRAFHWPGTFQVQHLVPEMNPNICLKLPRYILGRPRMYLITWRYSQGIPQVHLRYTFMYLILVRVQTIYTRH